MILAAVIPYHHPRGTGSGRPSSCVVVIIDTERPPAESVLAHEEIPAGRLACVEHGAFPCPTCASKPYQRGTLHFRRVVGPDEIYEITARVVALVVEHGAEEARIEDPPGTGVEGDRARAIGAALLEALPIGADLVPGTKGDLAARLRVLLKDEGSAVGGTVEPLSAAVLLQGSSPTTRSACSQQTDTSHSGTAEPTPPAPLAQPPEEVVPPVEVRAAKAWRRVAGIDPGSRHVAVTVLEGEAPPVRHVASLALNIGRDVPLTTPKVITRKDGATYTKTTRHEVTDADVEQLIRDVAGFLALHEVDAANVETASFSYEGAGALLLRSNRYGGVIEGALRGAGLPVRSTMSREWRAVVKRMVGAGTWREAVLTLVTVLPPDAGPHVLDAAGCALLSAAPPPEVRPAPRPRAPGAKRTTRSREERRARQDAERAAAGCLGDVCRARGKRGHAPECPIKVAQRAKVADKMKGNDNARKGASE